MPINVSEAIDLDTGEIVTVTRTSSGSYVDGLWVPGSTSTFKTLCSVQQPTPQELKVVPEGETNKDIRKFISKKPLRTTNDKTGEIADIVSYKGKQFRMMWEGDWNAFGHSTMLGAVVNNAT
jgi:hypothetical protein